MANYTLPAGNNNIVGDFTSEQLARLQEVNSAITAIRKTVSEFRKVMDDAQSLLGDDYLQAVIQTITDEDLDVMPSHAKLSRNDILSSLDSALQLTIFLKTNNAMNESHTLAFGRVAYPRS